MRSFAGGLRLQFRDALLGLGKILALLEFLHQLLEVRQRLRRQLDANKTLSEVVVDRITTAILRILLEDLLEAIDRAGIPACAEIEEAHQIPRLAQAIARLAKLRLDLGHQAAVRIPRYE